jgi:hypothetical protein
VLQDLEHLELARRHVREANVRVDAQRRLIARLEVGGHPTRVAEDLLDSLLETTHQMEVHRDYLEGRAHRA